MTRSNPVYLTMLRNVVRLTSAAVITVAALVLLGWVLHNETLKRIVPGIVAMNPVTALNFIMAAVALRLLEAPTDGAAKTDGAANAAQRSMAQRSVARILASCVALIGLLCFGAILLQRPGIDQWLFHDQLGIGSTIPNRMAPNTAMNFIFIGLSLLLIDVETRKGARPSQFVALAVALIALLAAIGYLYGAVSFYQVGKTYIPMAVHTATNFLMLATGILCARPDKGLAARFTSDGAGGIMVRRMLIFIIGIPITLGGLIITLQKAELYDPTFRFAVYVVLIMVFFSIMVWNNATSLDRKESERDRAEEALRRAHDELETRVQERTAELATANTSLVAEVKERQRAEVELQQAHDQLEVRVQQRTAELATANDSLQSEIVERKRAEEQAQQARQLAETATQVKSEFLANMSHELRTPLNAIIGFSEILEDQTFGELNPRQTKYVSNVLTSGRHLLQLINDILDLAKIEAGRLDLDAQPFAVSSALQDVATIVKTLANKKNVQLHVETPSELPALTADQPKFKQILYNLLSNAIKFTPEGGTVILKAEIESGALMRIAVSDTGIGIKAEDQERVFGEFEQVDSSYGRQQQGTGLGLALTKRLVELHGGRIWVESEGIEGKGSTFVFTLPVDGPAAQSQLPEALYYGAIADSESRPLVLIVEDNAQASELLTLYLADSGYRIACAYDGAQALQMADELKPDVITLDVMLPQKDGWEVLATLKSASATQNVPIIMVSMTEDRQLAFSLGAIGFLTKPVDKNQLTQAVGKAIVGKSAPTVLVVDDESTTVEMLGDVLRHQGCRVLQASGGQQAIDLAIAHLPDVMVLDLMMPDVTGFDVVRQLREHPQAKEIPILVFTAKDITDEDRQRLNNGIQSIIGKGGKEELMSALAALSLTKRDV